MSERTLFSKAFTSLFSQLAGSVFPGTGHRTKRSRRRMGLSSPASGKSAEVLEDRFLLAGATGVDNSLGAPTDLQNLKGDFDGDGNEDIARLTDTGEWQIGISDGAGSHDFSKWSHWKTSTLQEVHVGDFNGDGKDDIAGLFGKGRKKNWWVGISNGSHLNNKKFDRWDTQDGLDQVHVGDFDGDGKDDIAGLFGTGAKKTWEVGVSSGSDFTIEDWGRWNTTGGLDDVVVGDFNGDGKDDIAGLFKGKHWRVGEAGAHSFDLSRWATWAFASEGLDQLEVKDVDGDGDDDVTGVDSHGRSWTSHSSGTDFSLEYDAVSDANAGSVELLDDGTLKITGTTGSDDVTTKVEDGNVLVKLKGDDDPHTDDDVYARFDVSEVARILFLGDDGDDRFVNRTRIDSEAHGGAGDDILVGGGGDDSLFGDRGRDRLRGRHGNDTLRGGVGRDRLEGGQGSDDFLGNENDDDFEDESGEDRRHDGNTEEDNGSTANGNGDNGNGHDQNGNDGSHNGNDDNGNGHDQNGNDGSHNGNDDNGNGHDHNGNDGSHNGNDDNGNGHHHNGNDDDHNGNDDNGNGHDANDDDRKDD